MIEGKANTEIFGLRVMFDTLCELSDRLDALYPGLEHTQRRLEGAFGNPLYIYLSREDKVAQAVSLQKATQTGLWHVAPDGSELERLAPHRDPAYDREAIGHLVKELEVQDNAWREWFDAHGIEPLRLTYEELSHDPLAGLRTVLAKLGADTSLASRVIPKTAKLADVQSENWKAQFHLDNSRQ